MKYNYKGKEYEIEDALVDGAMESLPYLSLSEACEMILADEGRIENEEQNALDKLAQGQRRYEKSTKPRKKTEKVRKIDFEKGYLLEIMRKALENEANIEDFWIKTETELYFTYNNNKYTVKLTKHRPKK